MFAKIGFVVQRKDMPFDVTWSIQNKIDTILYQWKAKTNSDYYMNCYLTLDYSLPIHVCSTIAQYSKIIK